MSNIKLKDHNWAAEGIYDTNQSKSQQTINSDVSTKIGQATLQTSSQNLSGATNELKGRADTLDSKYDNVVTVANTQPSSEYNKVWLPLTVSEGTQVPTWAEHQALESSLNGAITSETKARQKTGAANLLPYPYLSNSGTDHGVTYVVNSDGSVTINGTSTGSAFLLSLKDFGSTSFNSRNVSTAAYKAYLFNAPATVGLVYFQSTKNTIIEVPNGTSVSNVTVYPMICFAEDVVSGYQKYAMTNNELTGALTTQTATPINPIVDPTTIEIKRFGNVVTVSIGNVVAVTGTGTWLTYFVVPVGFRPAKDTRFVARDLGNSNFYNARIMPNDGVMQINIPNGTTANAFFTVTYII